LFLARFKKTPNGNEKTQIIDERFDTEHRLELTDILIKNNLHVKKLQFWGSIF